MMDGRPTYGAVALSFTHFLWYVVVNLAGSFTVNSALRLTFSPNLKASPILSLTLAVILTLTLNLILTLGNRLTLGRLH